MARTATIKNKHALNKSNQAKEKKERHRAPTGVVKIKDQKGTPPSKAPKTASGLVDLLRKRNKKKTYTAKELNLPELNKITPIGVVKPKGKKKGKVFVDDKESMSTILAMVQAEKEGQIESKIMKARQLEEVREARKIEAEKKEAERKAQLEDAKDSLRKKRKRKTKDTEDEGDSLKQISMGGTKPCKLKKRVAFA
ncbi:putative 60s ribosomal subunit assembly export protein loc1 protein [Ceratocystis lukuohia]|uniref:60S ribosomal subunit assembly/export protein LOC1 n=3 Tax=Ceratocystis TaxID=5157 RepID=A0A0F8DKQ9_CERFI|nr:60S ribosomal subunit assembly/export protein LOC1 [Ceratocystis platani]PHH55938.1 60S ribosomal subunit assembly/export protein loc-1 [Ceratocystis fimbriata CBS 114723]